MRDICDNCFIEAAVTSIPTEDDDLFICWRCLAEIEGTEEDTFLDTE